jgi:multiple antibiotic resistance protein
MLELMRDFLLAFVPIFVAVDIVGVLPLYLSLTEGLAALERRAIIAQSLITAIAIAVGFIFLGKGIFGLLGITVHDFMVAGGVLLFVISTVDLVTGRKLARQAGTLGAVPLGTPLIVGPAVLTTSLLLVDVYGYGATLLAVLVNILLAGAVLLAAGRFERLLGQAGSRAVSKVASLILAAIAVMIIRRGLVGILSAA